MSSTWVSQFPGPIINGGNVEGITTPDGPNPASGAVAAVAASPTNADLVYVGSVNGGIWKTTNATAGSPTWTNLTDFALPAQSIDSIALSPLDATSNTVFGGTGSTSSDAFDGSPGFGVVRTTDGGSTWSVLAQPTFAGRIINSIVPTSITSDGTINTEVVLAGTLFDGGGVYRSTNGGTSFTRISGSNGLPSAGVSSVVADPTNANRFYTAVNATQGGGSAATAGVYESMNGGLNWIKTVVPPSGLTTSMRILLSVGRTTGVVYAMEINSSGTLSAVLRSPDQGATWTSMGQPSPSIFPGAQGIVHGSIVADPNDSNVVYVAGDRQNSPFPNVNGATSFSGNVFRGVFTATGGTTWQNVIGNGNGGGASGTSPHPDSRSMVFDANGNILQGNDGGIYRLANPSNNSTRIWQSVQGNITPTEAHSAAFDSFNGLAIAGTQDNGTPMQNTPGGRIWNEFLGGDGGNVAVDDSAATTAKGFSIRYSSFTFLQSFNRSEWSSSGSFITVSFIGLNIVAGAGTGQNLLNFDPNLQFYQDFVLNSVDPTRMLIGTQNIYESTNQGDSLTNLGSAGGQVGALFQNTGNNGMVYGGIDPGGAANVGLFYVAANNPNTGAPTIKYRASSSSPITTLTAYPGTTIEAITADPNNDAHLFVLDTNQQVWSSFDSGSTWTNLTANLDPLANLGTGTDLRTIQIFSPSASPINTVLLVGGQGGIWQMRRPGAAGTSWTAVGTGLPHALVYDLDYDYSDNVLAAGTLGRGVWTLTGFFRGGGGTGIASVPGDGGGASFLSPLDILSPSSANLANIPQLQVTPDGGGSSDTGGSDAVNSDGTSTGTQALTATTGDSAAPQAPTVLIVDVSIGRGLVNQAVDNTDPDSFGLL